MPKPAIPLRDRLILALDVPSTDEAWDVVETLGDAVTFYKIGLQLFPVGGAHFAKDLIKAGKKVFLDYKFYDIGNTVEKAVASAVTLGGHLLTLHGDRAIAASAVKGRGSAALQLLGVTVLTSMDQAALADMGYHGSVEDLVLARAKLCLEAGCDGIVASAQEVGRLRRELGDDFLIVTPGIRSAGIAANDQKRVATPGEAIRAGADYLVVGREVTQAGDPKAAAAHIFDQIEEALNSP